MGRRVPAERFLALPALVFLAFFFAYPLLSTLWDALQVSPGTSMVRAGAVLGESSFRRAAIRTLLLVVVAAPIEVLLGTTVGLVAATFYQGKGRLVILVGFGFPVLVPPIAVGLGWRLFLDPLRGPAAHYWGALTGNVLELWGSPVLAILGICAADVWQWSGLIAMVCAAVAATLPLSVLEQARLDGLSGGDILRLVQWPFVRKAVILVATLRVVDLLRSFDLIYILTQGGPGSATETVSFFAYQTGFVYLQQERAEAQAIWLLLASSCFLAVFAFVSGGRGSLRPRERQQR